MRDASQTREMQSSGEEVTFESDGLTMAGSTGDAEVPFVRAERVSHGLIQQVLISVCVFLKVLLR